MRNIQHKKEAYWFYRFLSIFYDRFVNPFFWTERMRDRALELAQLDRRDLKTVDVGSGTGFTTQGIVRHVDAACVICIDQSQHQMARAKRKPELRDCRFQIGDAEDLPFPDNHFDRYVSAGSIEYWPDPQRGIEEARRVLKPGGIAVMIGPLRPANPLGGRLADSWMLFPEESDYLNWFRAAGFSDIRTCPIAPHWVMYEKYGIAVRGVKSASDRTEPAANKRSSVDTTETMKFSRKVMLIGRLMIGTLAGFLFIPMAVAAHFLTPLRRMFGTTENKTYGNDSEPLNRYQRTALTTILIIVAAVVIWSAV